MHYISSISIVLTSDQLKPTLVIKTVISCVSDQQSNLLPEIPVLSMTFFTVTLSLSVFRLCSGDDTFNCYPQPVFRLCSGDGSFNCYPQPVLGSVLEMEVLAVTLSLSFQAAYWRWHFDLLPSTCGLRQQLTSHYQFHRQQF